MFESFLTVPEISFSPIEYVLIYGLLILTVSSILTEKIIGWFNIKSWTAKISSFLLMASVLGHLIFVENNSLAQSLIIIAIVAISLFTTILHKTLFPARQVTA